MSEIQSGILDQSLTILPILQELMAPNGLLNTTANRERVFRDLSATDQKLRLATILLNNKMNCEIWWPWNR